MSIFVLVILSILTDDGEMVNITQSKVRKTEDLFLIL